MNHYQTLKLQFANHIAEITLNRPQIHNAFDDILIEEIRKALKEIENNARALVITGAGKSFCAGADMHWMKRVKDYDLEQNYKDTYKLSQMFEEFFCLKIPTIAKVNGAAVGGGMGFVAVCDIVVAAENAIFSLSEARLGLIPACIFPYILKRAGGGSIRLHCLSGKRFSALEAKDIGLVNKICSLDSLNREVQAICNDILQCAPGALQKMKEVLSVLPKMEPEEYMEYTAKIIAKLRTSEEGQEGFRCFLDKKIPYWRKNV